jgi:hypothetical protein
MNDTYIPDKESDEREEIECFMVTNFPLRRKDVIGEKLIESLEAQLIRQKEWIENEK